jgi:SET domain-containing protein
MTTESSTKDSAWHKRDDELNEVVDEDSAKSKACDVGCYCCRCSTRQKTTPRLDRIWIKEKVSFYVAQQPTPRL